MRTRTEITPSDDIIDVRDVIARVEELEDIDAADRDDDKAAEHARLSALLADLAGYGGDEHWREDWYPVTLVRDSHFRDYAEQLADDIGAINPDAGWPNNCIDWERAARELQQDYSSTEFEGVTYWYR